MTPLSEIGLGKMTARLPESLKTFRKLVLACTLYLALCTGEAKAQVATLDSRKILATMPVFAKVDTLVQEESMKYASEYKQKLEVAQILTRKSDSLQRTSSKSLDFDEVAKAAQKAQLDFADFEKKVQQKLADYKALILNPYYDKVNAAVKVVATRLKYKQVMDIQAVNFAYIDPSADITEDVIRQLKN